MAPVPTCGCCEPLLDCFQRLTTRRKKLVDDRDKFEQTIQFLSKVPLFKGRLPRAEWPAVAQLLEETTWRPGATLIRQGEVGQRFFLIYSGLAAVVSLDGQQQESAELSEGDWLGGHSLVADRPNVATVIAKGPEPLVTLSMSKDMFEQAGLRTKLDCPKRPAMHGGMKNMDGAPSSFQLQVASCGTVDSEAERAFVLRALRNNPNLRAFCDSSDFSGVLEDIAASAQIFNVPCGTTVATFGELGNDFFIIREGGFEVIGSSASSSSGKTSAEAASAKSSTVERLRRKQNFLQQLHKSKAKAAMSMVYTGRPANPEQQPRLRHRCHSNDFVNAPKDASQKNEVEITRLRSGDTFGELSLLYNCRREATFRASEDSVVYTISRKHFTKFCCRNSGRQRFEEYCALLDEVDLLTPLLRSERRTLASRASHAMAFEPCQRVLYQGRERQNAQWYIILSGSAIMSKEEEVGAPKTGDQVITELGRGAHFGARSLLGRDSAGRIISDFNIDAGPKGMTCLTFDGELIQGLIGELAHGVEEAGEVSPVGLPPPVKSVEFNYEAQQLRCRNKCKATLRELEETCLLGKGAFGEVFLVRDPQDQEGQVYALKRLSKGHILREMDLEQLCWERDLHSMLDSPFVIHLYRTFKDHQFVYLLMEAAMGGDLYRIISHHRNIFAEDNPPGSATAFYLACCIAGIEHLHERRIVYRDLKPENVMMHTNGYGKISDMGLARFVCGKTNTQAGTPDYMAPEIIDPPSSHDTSADWWSLGVLAVELFTGQTPFYDDGLDDPEERLLAIRRSQEKEVRLPLRCPFLLKDLIYKLLKKIPQRLGAEGGAAAIRQHGFFCKPSFDFDALLSQTLPSPIMLPWKEPENPERGGLHSETLPEESDMFVTCLDENQSGFADF
mmetsp:Transcript_18735/g.41058  ORF Transcript_18735/g.41058 Transcript_18735/m.41058 type:complete len:900 (+) Transcript_18735:42-2741(+)